MWGVFFGTEKFPDEVQVRAQIDRDPKTLAGYKSLFALEDTSFSGRLNKVFPGRRSESNHAGGKR